MLINPYYKENTKFVSIFVPMYLSFFNFFIMFCVETIYLNRITCLMVFLLVPFSWKITLVICQIQNIYHSDKFQELCKQNKVIDINSIDRIMRQNNLFTDLFNTHQNDQRKINYFNLIANVSSSIFESNNNATTHNDRGNTFNNKNLLKQYILEQYNYSQDYGVQNTSINVSGEEMKEQKNMFLRVKQIMKNFFERVIFNGKKFSFSSICVYLVFLLEIKESKKLYWLNYLAFRSKSKVQQSLKFLQILQSIHNIFQNEKIILKSTVGHRSPFYEGFMDVIVFEQKVEKAHQLLDKCINLKLDILNIMKQKLIVLQDIMQKIEIYQKILTQLRKILSQLALMNEDSVDLIQLQIYYLQCLSFGESDINIGQINQYKKAYLSEITDIFSKDSCAVFIQHDLNTNSSYFKRTSQNFERIFLIKSNEILGKKIDTLMPSIIQQQHSNYIREFLNEESDRFGQLYNQIQENNELPNQLNQNKNIKEKSQIKNIKSIASVCRMDQKLIFGLNGKRHIVPLNVDLRVNSLGIDEFGFTAKIKKVKNQFDYILYNTSNFEVVGMSKNISESLFSDVQTSNINLPILFPFLQQQIEKTNDNTQGQATDYYDSERSVLKINLQQNGDIQNIYGSGKTIATSNSKRTTVGNTQIVHKQNLHLKVFDFIVIIDNSKQNKKRSLKSLGSTIFTKDTSMSKMMIDKETMFIFMEIKVYETDYKYISNLNYLQISKVKLMNPFEQSHLILSQIKDNYEQYLLSFSNQSLERIIRNLENASKAIIPSQIMNQSKQQKHINTIKSLNDDKYHPIKSSNEENTSSPDNIQENNKPPSWQLLNSLNSIDQIQIQILDQKKESNQNIDNQKKNNEKQNGGTFNEIIEEEGSISNRSENRDEFQKVIIINQNNNNESNINNTYLNNPQSSYINQSMMELNVGIQSYNMLPLLSPDGSNCQLNLKQQNEQSQNNLFNFQNPNTPTNDQSYITGIGGDLSSNDIVKNGFAKRNTIATIGQLNSSSFNFMPQDSYSKGNLQNLSTMDSKLLNQKNRSINNIFQDLSKNVSPSKLQTPQSQQKFFSGEVEFRQNDMRITDLRDTNKILTEELRKKKNRKQKQHSSNFEEFDHIDHRHHGNDWQAFNNKAQKVINNKYKNDEHKRIHDIQVEIASTNNSKQSSSASAKRQLTKVFQTNQKMPSIKIIQFIGILCFVILTSVTVWQYQTVIDSLSNSQHDLEAFGWPSEFRSIVYQMVKNNNLLVLINTNDFTQNDTIKISFNKTVTDNLRFSQNSLLAHISQFERSNPDRLIFKSLSQKQIEFVIPLYYNKSIISNTTSRVTLQPGYVGENYNMSIQYGVVVFNQFVFWQAFQIGSGRSEYFSILNQMSIVDAVKEIENQLITVQQEEDSKIETQLNSLMAIIFSVSAGCVGIILPLYSFIQNKKDQIVTLLSTFTSEKISSLIQNIYSSYYNDKSSLKYPKSIPNNINFMKETESRKQNLSQTTRLPRINKIHLILVFFIYIFVVSYPVIIKFVTSSYLKQASSSLNLIIQTNTIKAYLNEIIAINYFGIVAKLYPDKKSYKIDKFLDYIDTLSELQSSFEQKVNQLTEGRYSSSKYDQNSYNSLFYPLIEDDICETLKKQPQYITNTTVFKINDCSNVYKGFLKKGFQLSFKEYINTINLMAGICKIKDTSEINQAKNALKSSINIKDFTDFQEYLEETLNIMRKFVLDANTDHYNFIINVQLILIIYQVIMMILIFGVGWFLFCKYINDSLNKTKRYLQVIDINTLIDNSYILNFIKNNINI